MPPVKKRPRVEADWSWVGTEVTTVEDITDEHRRRAAGLHNIEPCSSFPRPEGPDGAFVIPTKDACKKMACRLNPRCYNHLGINEVSSEDTRKKYVDAAGEEPEMRDGPAGLRNLGATCYANAFLQMWFHNVAFRNGLYACDMTDTTSPLYHLVSIFASMQMTKRQTVDPSALVEALSLRTGEQQDAGEFSKLFMNHIETELHSQPDPKSRQLLESLFQGQLEYRTTCRGCGHASIRPEHFLELELSLKDGTDLPNRLEALMHPEILNGDNQYYCSACDKKCDATRQIHVRALPEYLHFSLLRFTYDPKIGNRRKSKASIAYPKSTTFAQVGYDLVGVIVHEGTSPHSGHFTCQVLDQATRTWYNCSDTDVEEIPSNPVKKQKARADGMEVSKDAYMLVYRRRADGLPDPADPPQAMVEAVEADNAALEKEREEWVGKCGDKLNEFDELKKKKMEVIDCLSGVDCIVPRDELAKWFNGDKDHLEKPFSYADITCDHGGIDPRRARETRLISRAALDLMGVAPLEVCAVCIEEGFLKHIASSDRDEQVKSFTDLNVGDRTIAVPQKWLQDWRNNKAHDLPTGNGYSLYCAHDQPWPGSRAMDLVTPEALALLQSSVGEFDTFSNSADHCARCSADEVAEQGVAAQWRQDNKKERKLRTMCDNVVFGQDCYVLSDQFWAEWQEYHREPKPRPTFEAWICEHGGVPFDAARDMYHFIAQDAWGKFQELYGEHRPVIVRFPDTQTAFPASFASRGAQLTELKTCVPCRRERLLVWADMKLRIYLSGGSARRRDFIDMDIEKGTTIKDVRLEVLQKRQISPMSQRLYIDDRICDDPAATMESLGLLKDDTMRCEEVIEVDDDAPAGREGFHGTALVGGGGAGLNGSAKRSRSPGSGGGSGGGSGSGAATGSAPTNGSGVGNGNGVAPQSLVVGEAQKKDDSDDGGCQPTGSDGRDKLDDHAAQTPKTSTEPNPSEGVDDPPHIACPDCTFFNDIAAQFCTVCFRPLAMGGDDPMGT